MKIFMDCSNGATYQVAPKVFSDLGADVTPLFVSPDGKNINEKCGSQHPEILGKKVVEKNRIKMDEWATFINTIKCT